MDSDNKKYLIKQNISEKKKKRKRQIFLFSCEIFFKNIPKVHDRRN